MWWCPIFTGSSTYYTDVYYSWASSSYLQKTEPLSELFAWEILTIWSMKIIVYNPFLSRGGKVTVSNLLVMCTLILCVSFMHKSSLLILMLKCWLSQKGVIVTLSANLIAQFIEVIRLEVPYLTIGSLLNLTTQEVYRKLTGRDMILSSTLIYHRDLTPFFRMLHLIMFRM